MKNNITRSAVFAHFDKNNVIEDYIIFFLQELKRYVKNIVFVSDSNLNANELQKISPYIVKAISFRHGEYDFGSYKRGYFYLKDNGLLKESDELIFVNDSCYAPLFDFKDMFTEMSLRSCDFWGNTYNRDTYFEKKYHIQSYFVVLKSNVFQSEAFNNFIIGIKKQNSKKDVVLKYEYGLTKCLDNSGFKGDVYCEFSKKYWNSYLLFNKELILLNKSPFLKRSIMLNKEYILGEKSKLKNIITKNSTYDYKKYIDDDIRKNKEKFNLIYSILKHIYRIFILFAICIYEKFRTKNENFNY